MFLDGLSRADSGRPGSLLAEEVSRPLFFSNYDVTCTGRRIPPVEFFFPFCFDIPQHSLSLDLNVFLSAPTDLLRLLLSVVFSSSVAVLRTLSTSCLSQCLTFRGVHGRLWRPPFSPGLKAPPLLTHSFSTCVVLLFSAIPKHRDSLFSAIVPADECLALLQFRRVGDKLN